MIKVTFSQSNIFYIGIIILCISNYNNIINQDKNVWKGRRHHKRIDDNDEAVASYFC